MEGTCTPNTKAQSSKNASAMLLLLIFLFGGGTGRTIWGFIWEKTFELTFPWGHGREGVPRALDSPPRVGWGLGLSLGWLSCSLSSQAQLLPRGSMAATEQGGWEGPQWLCTWTGRETTQTQASHHVSIFFTTTALLGFTWLKDLEPLPSRN